MTVTSQPGEGSVFAANANVGDTSDTKLITYQAYAEAEKDGYQRKQIPQIYLGPKRVLVVDDGDSNRRLVRLILEKAGCRVKSSARTGSSGKSPSG